MNEYYQDLDEGFLYVRIGADPDTVTIAAKYEIYLGTYDAHWHRDPLDVSTRVVYWEPLIEQSPTILAATSDLLEGFLPSTSASVVVSNVTQLLQSHLYDSSFAKAPAEVYHYLDDLIVDNI